MEKLWNNERRLWLEGVSVYHELLHPQCIMTFSAPVGIMQGDTIAKSLQGVPRWTDVQMTEQSTSAGDDTVVLAYRAEGHRENSDPYFAYCSSTYVRQENGWRIIQHQQTPID